VSMSLSGRFGKDVILLFLRGIELRFLGRSARSSGTIASYPGSMFVK